MLWEDVVIVSSIVGSGDSVAVEFRHANPSIVGATYPKALNSVMESIVRFTKLYGSISGRAHHVAVLVSSASDGDELDWLIMRLDGSLYQTPVRPKLSPLERNSVSHFRAVDLKHSRPFSWH